MGYSGCDIRVSWPNPADDALQLRAERARKERRKKKKKKKKKLFPTSEISAEKSQYRTSYHGRVRSMDEENHEVVVLINGLLEEYI